MLLCDALTGLVVTHLMRTLIKALGLLRLNLSRQIVYLIFTALVFAFVYAFVSITLEEWLRAEPETVKGYTTANKVLRATYGTFLFLLIWNLIYFTYHYIVKNRTEKLDKMRLESLVKELQLKTIKAHINPHFIFNALNSIRALVDENPARARTAITELSNLLRSSMQAEKQETTPLERELNIVKDYLALEHIRFEDRLRVEYDIDEDTLDQPVPPMMLQTLVENAIKHGVSKQVNGGLIRIISDFRADHHELIVQNTGKLNGSGGAGNGDGFGLASTNNRLRLLFGSKASFEIKDIDENTVEAKIIFPVHML
ncbi:histidine kinase [Filimonas zeae]|uniref:Histidine kinase n=2 Tax=Filimonas zeae TaxID=1737353 RepID=A0A917J0M2_9BACT|nr:histidine kinase [Filimonas zeae]